METKVFDVVVIGGGSGGYAAARTAVELGKKVAVVDGGEELGGLCILKGCMPSKTLIETANRNLAIREASKFGIKVGESEVDMEALIERKRRLIGEFRDYRAGQLQDGLFELVRGRAEFVDANRLRVEQLEGGEVEIRSKTIIIATGSQIFVPEVKGLADVGFLTSDDVLDSADAPDSIVVLGGGAIALELAHFYDGIGKMVTVIQRSEHLLTGMDHDLADELEASLKARGLTIYCGTELVEVIKEDGKKTVIFKHDGEEQRVCADEILCALGRKPNTNSLKVENAGVKLDRGKVGIQLTMESSAENIFAAGDVCGPYEIVHLAIEQGELAAKNAVKLIDGVDPTLYEKMDYRLKVYGIFTDPQVASVGLTEIEAKEMGMEILVETHPFNDHGKSMVHGSEFGFVKLIAEAKSKKILGGSVVGPEGVELIHEVVMAMAFDATAFQFAKVPHYHPTLSEIWTYPAEELADA